MQINHIPRDRKYIDGSYVWLICKSCGIRFLIKKSYSIKGRHCCNICCNGIFNYDNKYITTICA